MDKSSLHVRNLGCIRQQKFLFANISFQLQPGETLLVEGPNGSGKSSLLRLLTGLATPSQGEIFWQNQGIQQCREAYIQQLHYIGHANGIKLGLTVAENLQLALQLSLASSSSQEKILEQLQLLQYKNTLAKNLSAGQKRRIALAKLFLFPKKIWILDEPLTALDAATQQLFLSTLESHLHQGGMAVISSHHPLELNQAIIKHLRFESC